MSSPLKDRDILVLGIESSCDETSAAVTCNTTILSNVIANQKVHQEYGGVVPELASRAHLQNIVPVTHAALSKAGVGLHQLHALAYTRGPGLAGALMVGSAFARSLSLALGIPVIEINHLQAHILAHFIRQPGKETTTPRFPFLCLTVSGGHTQLIRVNDKLQFNLMGSTIDDAAGEAFDKCASMLGLGYPGGPLIDKYAATGNAHRFIFPRARTAGLNFSYSGLKTSVLYFLRDAKKKNENFIHENLNDLCASVQQSIIHPLIEKLERASAETGITEIAIAGGVSANSGLRKALQITAQQRGWNVFLPDLEFCTDNAAMIAVNGYFKYLHSQFGEIGNPPLARWRI